MKKFFLSFSLFFALMLLTACGSSANTVEYATAAAAEPVMLNMKTADVDTAAGSLSESEIQSSRTSEQQSQNHSEKLIRTFSLSIETEEMDELSSTLRERITRFGGYIEYFYTYGTSSAGNSRSAMITARVPADQAEAFLAEGFGRSTVLSYNESAEDVTLTYTDLEARLSALKSEQERLTELIAQAETMEAIITLESRLTEIRYEIESITSSLRSYDNRITYSTISITISEVKVAEAEVQDGFIKRVVTGFRKSTNRLFTLLEDLIILLLSHILTILLIAAVILLLIRFSKKKEKNGKKAKLFDRKPDLSSAGQKQEPASEKETEEIRNLPSEQAAAQKPEVTSGKNEM